MPDSWQKAYCQLTTFLAYNPDIRIKPDATAIPENLRPEFYKLFYTTRAAFIKQRFAALLSDAEAINTGYKQAEGALIRQTGVEDITLPFFLQSFLDSPANEFIKTLFDLLFNLLKGNTDVEAFERQAIREIEPKMADSIRQMYEKWAVLCIVKLLRPDKILTVFSPKQRIVGQEPDGGVATPVYETHGPPPTMLESNFLSFNNQHYSGLTVPDFMLHSLKTRGFVSFRTGYREALIQEADHAKTRQWYPLGPGMTFLPRMVLIYTSGAPKEICLVADKKTICRPDMVLKCTHKDEWLEKGGAEELRLGHSFLKPRLGTYIVCRNGNPDDYGKAIEAEENINVLEVGLDSAGLKPVVSALTAGGE